MSCKFSKIIGKQLKSIVFDFYTSEEISTAKEQLINIVDKLELSKWPRPARRNNSDNKSRLEVDDLYSMMTFIDENSLNAKVPVFVARNVDKLSSVKMEEGELRMLMNKLDKLDVTEKLSHLDKLSELNKLDELKKLSKLEELSRLDGLSKIMDKLISLDFSNLSKIDKLDAFNFEQ